MSTSTTSASSLRAMPCAPLAPTLPPPTTVTLVFISFLGIARILRGGFYLRACGDACPSHPERGGWEGVSEGSQDAQIGATDPARASGDPSSRVAPQDDLPRHGPTGTAPRILRSFLRQAQDRYRFSG